MSAELMKSIFVRRPSLTSIFFLASTYCMDFFRIFVEIEILTICFSNSLTWETMEVKISKTLLKL